MPFDGDARWQIDITAADRTAAAFSSVDRRLKGLEASVASMGRTMAAGVGQTVAFGRSLQTLAGAYGVVAAGQRALQAGFKVGDLGEQAEQLGVTTDQLQAYRLMAAQAGVSAEQLDAALLKLTRSMGAANDGNDEMIARFEKLGVKLIDSEGRLRGPAEVLPELSRGLLQVSADTERSALMAEMLGKSGARLKTMLEEWAKGNDRLVASAKAQNAVAGKDAIAAWDKLGDQLLVANQRFETLVGTMGKPVALVGLQAMNVQLALMNSTMAGIQKGWNWLTSRVGSGVALEDMQKEAGQVQGRIDQLHQQPSTTGNQALLQREYARLGVLQQQISDKMTSQYDVVLPPITVTGDRNPVGKQASAAGAKLEERLRDLQVERAALEKALAAFDVRGTETVDEVDRKLDTQIKLDKKIADVLKDVPPNSVLARQLTQEATIVSQLNTRLDERKRLLSEGEGVTQRYGDGSREAARMVEQLNKMLAAGAIDAGTHERALRATTLAADDQVRAYRSAAGGADAFIAGLEQGFADLERTNSAFESGKHIVDEMAKSITDLATGAEVDLGKIALSWANMLLQMELRAATSNIWNLITGKGPTDQGLGGMLGGWLGGLFGGGGEAAGSIGAGIGDVAGMIGFADGGRPPVGVASMVGERGPELFIPDRPGTIVPNDQLGNVGGAAPVQVIVQQTVQVGSVVSQAQHERDLALMGEQTKKAAIAGVLEARGTSSSYRRALRG